MSKLTDVYNSAAAYLQNELDRLDERKTGKELLANEFLVYSSRKHFTELSDIYKRLLSSLKNRTMMATVLPDIDEFSDVLYGYDPSKVLGNFVDDDALLAAFAKTFGHRNNMFAPRSLWRQFARGVLSSAKFLSRFSNADEFNTFVKSFSFNEYAVAALPMLLDKEIYGFGFPLACDFLKESGFNDYGKPDVHLKDIFYGVGIVDDESDFTTFKMIVKMAREVGEQPVMIDKLFWLIGSGKFEANGIRTRRLKSDFIAYYLALKKGK